mgnify:CR=1 FL=1
MPRLSRKKSLKAKKSKSRRKQTSYGSLDEKELEKKYASLVSEARRQPIEDKNYWNVAAEIMTKATQAQEGIEQGKTSEILKEINNRLQIVELKTVMGSIPDWTLLTSGYRF